MSISIRSALPTDVALLSGIAAAAKAHWGYPRAWLEQWTAQLTITADDLKRLDVRVVADANDTPMGFCATAIARPRWTVEHLWVLPSAMGRGIGRALLLDALARARSAAAVGLEIESDPFAAPFYARCGAREVGAIPAPMPGAAERTLPVLWMDA